MTQVVLEPLTAWDGPEKPRRRRTTMQTRWPETRDMISSEANELHAVRAVLEVDVRTARDITSGGGALKVLPTSDRLRLTLDLPNGGPMVFRSSGNFSIYLPDWECNARALALTLKALRDLDRWNVVGRGDLAQGAQYAGFMPALEQAARSVEPSRGTVEWARKRLLERTGLPAATPNGELLRTSRALARANRWTDDWEAWAGVFDQRDAAAATSEGDDDGA